MVCYTLGVLLQGCCYTRFLTGKSFYKNRALSNFARHFFSNLRILLFFQLKTKHHWINRCKPLQIMTNSVSSLICGLQKWFFLWWITWFTIKKGSIEKKSQEIIPRAAPYEYFVWNFLNNIVAVSNFAQFDFIHGLPLRRTPSVLYHVNSK